MSATAVSAGVFAVDLFSDAACSTFVQRQAYAINTCYTGTNATYVYNSLLYNVTKLSPTLPTFVLKGVQTKSYAICQTAIKAVKAFTPPVTTGACTGLRVGSSAGPLSGWYTQASWLPSLALPSGLVAPGAIVTGTSSCASGIVSRLTYVTLGACVPVTSSFSTSTVAGTYFTVTCIGSQMYVDTYMDSKCTLSAAANVFTGSPYMSSQTNCGNNVGFPSKTIYDPYSATYWCTAFSFATGGYFSTQIFADDMCQTPPVAITEYNLNVCYKVRVRAPPSVSMCVFFSTLPPAVSSAPPAGARAVQLRCHLRTSRPSRHQPPQRQPAAVFAAAAGRLHGVHQNGRGFVQRLQVHVRPYLAPT